MSKKHTIHSGCSAAELAQIASDVYRVDGFTVAKEFGANSIRQDGGQAPIAHAHLRGKGGTQPGG